MESTRDDLSQTLFFSTIQEPSAYQKIQLQSSQFRNLCFEMGSPCKARIVELGHQKVEAPVLPAFPDT